MRTVVIAIASSLLLVGGASAQDVANGEKLFRRCAQCHDIEKGVTKLGPTLKGVVGRPAGSVEGFKYSKQMQGSGLTWDEATLTEFLHDPKKKVPGTRMIFPGMKDDAQINDLIAYLQSKS